MNEPPAEGEGFRVLVARYRPRGTKREDETWDAWWPNLGPSKELHARWYGKSGAPIDWDEYRAEYLQQMRSQSWWIRGLAERVAKGETITLICSTACVDETRCHRSLLRALIEEQLAPKPPAPLGAVVRRRR